MVKTIKETYDKYILKETSINKIVKLETEMKDELELIASEIQKLNDEFGYKGTTNDVVALTFIVSFNNGNRGEIQNEWIITDEKIWRDDVGNVGGTKLNIIRKKLKDFMVNNTKIWELKSITSPKGDIGSKGDKGVDVYRFKVINPNYLQYFNH